MMWEIAGRYKLGCDVWTINFRRSQLTYKSRCIGGTVKVSKVSNEGDCEEIYAGMRWQCL